MTPILGNLFAKKLVSLAGLFAAGRARINLWNNVVKIVVKNKLFNLFNRN
ncbi:hypothetical protein [Candidatus Avelusimicrobium fimicolum]